MDVDAKLWLSVRLALFEDDIDPLDDRRGREKLPRAYIYLSPLSGYCMFLTALHKHFRTILNTTYFCVVNSEIRLGGAQVNLFAETAYET